MSRSVPSRPKPRWRALSVLLLALLVAASSLDGTRWSVCTNQGCAGVHLGSGSAARLDGVSEDGVSEDRVSGDRAGESGQESEGDCGCCCAVADTPQGEAPEPPASLRPARPACCGVLVCELAPALPSLDDGANDGPDLGWSATVAARVEVGSAPSPRHRPFGRAPPRPDRTTALRACTVLLL